MPLPVLPRVILGSEQWPRGGSEVPSILLTELHRPEGRRQQRRVAKLRRRSLDEGHLPPVATGTHGHLSTQEPKVEEPIEVRAFYRKSRWEESATHKQRPRQSEIHHARLALLRDKIHTTDTKQWDKLTTTPEESEELHRRRWRSILHVKKFHRRRSSHSPEHWEEWKPDPQAKRQTLFQQVATSSDWKVLDDQPPKLRSYCRGRILVALHASRAITVEEVLREAASDEDEELRSLAAQLLQEVAPPKAEVAPQTGAVHNDETPAPGQELASSIRRKMRAKEQAEAAELLRVKVKKKRHAHVTMQIDSDKRSSSPFHSNGPRITPRGSDCLLDKDAESKLVLALAREHHKSRDEIKTLLALFRNLDKDGNNMLSRDEFEDVVRHVYDLDAEATVPGELLDKQWESLSEFHCDGGVDFATFVSWIVHASEAEDVLVPDEQERKVREITRAFGLYISDVDSMKRNFTKFDSNKNGSLDQEEFRIMLADLMKLDASEMPKKKVQVYWQEIDTDKDGLLTFAEFLIWYCRSFKGLTLSGRW